MLVSPLKDLQSEDLLTTRSLVLGWWSTFQVETSATPPRGGYFFVWMLNLVSLCVHAGSPQAGVAWRFPRKIEALSSITKHMNLEALVRGRSGAASPMAWSVSPGRRRLRQGCPAWTRDIESPAISPAM